MSAPPHRSAGPAAIALIKRWEGCARKRSDGRIAAYPDPGTGGAPWTIGWGSTGSDITASTVWTQAQCDARLARDIQQAADAVSAAIGNASTSANQFDALVSFQYNTGRIARATLTAKHRAGDYEGARHEFARWVHAGGRVLDGLRRRRREEAALYARQ